MYFRNNISTSKKNGDTETYPVLSMDFSTRSLVMCKLMVLKWASSFSSTAVRDTIETRLNFSCRAKSRVSWDSPVWETTKTTSPGVMDSKRRWVSVFPRNSKNRISAFKKIELKAPYHALTNAGHISYIELDGDLTKNLDAFETIVRCMHDQGIGYGSINHPVDRDPICGYTGIINNECPCCNRKEKDLIEFKIKRLK